MTERIIKTGGKDYYVQRSTGKNETLLTGNNEAKRQKHSFKVLKENNRPPITLHLGKYVF